MTTVINCKKTKRFTKHQETLKENFRKKYGNTKQRTLNFKVTLLKQDLKATCKKLKTNKKKAMKGNQSIVDSLITRKVCTEILKEVI